VHQLTTPERQFAALLAAEPSRPFVTYYDEVTGERSELSVKSLANWVAKTHHLLGTELGLGPGDSALVALPAHWIAVPILLGCLTAGLELTATGATDVAFVGPDTLPLADAADVYAIAPAAAAVGFGDRAPSGASDYVTAVRPQADAWATVQLPAGPADPGLPGLTRGEVVAQAAGVGLAPGERLLSTRSWSGPDDWIAVLLAPLAVGGSLVIVANAPDDEVVQRRMQQERATRLDSGV
jgi:uncharacterized protein (TIGR03089 family)